MCASENGRLKVLKYLVVNKGASVDTADKVTYSTIAFILKLLLFVVQQTI